MQNTSAGLYTMHNHVATAREAASSAPRGQQPACLDGILPAPHRKERLSLAYVQAIAAVAGYVVSIPEPDLDGVDIQLRPRTPMFPAIDIQLKSTTKLTKKGSTLKYSLNRRNYDLLIGPSYNPRLLVVLDLPKDENQWLTISDAMVLRKRAYWLSLRNWRPTQNKYRVTVHFPVSNVLSVDSLHNLMNSARTGRIG